MWPDGSAFASLDALRRSQGLLSDAMGTGPREGPWAELAAWPGARLRDYGGPDGGPPLLIVPAPFKRAYIWDLMPAVSAVRRALDAGMRVFLLEWLPWPAGHPARGLEDSALELPEAALERIEEATGQSRAIVAGHSLGGTLGAIFAAMRPDRVAGLLLLDAPLAFGRDGGPLAAAVAGSPPATEITARFGDAVPGSAINLFSARAEPRAFVRQPAADTMACAGRPERLAVHLRVRRWTLDELPMPARLFEAIAEDLYRGDRFRDGTLRIGGEPARLADVAAPIAAVVNPSGLIVPPASMLHGLRAAPRAARLVLRYRAEPGVMIQHLGPLVGPGAHARLWPRLLGWLIDRR